MLHGCTQTSDDFANGTRMNALAEERQCFVLYPEQTQAANRSRCWNWFKRGDQRREQGEPAILAGMTREVMNYYRIDPTKVYVAGLSAGGAMAAVMGTAYPELYAAVGIHSGLACGSAHDLPSAFAAMRGTPALMAGRTTGSTPAAPATPTIVFHGDRDRTVHPRNGEQVVSQSVAQNGASSADASIERGQVPGGHPYTRTVHRDSTGRVVLEHWLVHGGGHAWFGGSPRGSYTDPKGPDAAREMVRFFYQNAFKRSSGQPARERGDKQGMRDGSSPGSMRHGELLEVVEEGDLFEPHHPRYKRRCRLDAFEAGGSVAIPRCVSISPPTRYIRSEPRFV